MNNIEQKLEQFHPVKNEELKQRILQHRQLVFPAAVWKTARQRYRKFVEQAKTIAVSVCAGFLLGAVCVGYTIHPSTHSPIDAVRPKPAPLIVMQTPPPDEQISAVKSPIDLLRLNWNRERPQMAKVNEHDTNENVLRSGRKLDF